MILPRNDRHIPREATIPAILVVAPDDHVTTREWTEQLVRRAQQNRQAKKGPNKIALSGPEPSTTVART